MSLSHLSSSEADKAGKLIYLDLIVFKRVTIYLSTNGNMETHINYCVKSKHWLYQAAGWATITFPGPSSSFGQLQLQLQLQLPTASLLLLTAGSIAVHMVPHHC